MKRLNPFLICLLCYGVGMVAGVVIVQHRQGRSLEDIVRNTTGLGPDRMHTVTLTGESVGSPVPMMVVLDLRSDGSVRWIRPEPATPFKVVEEPAKEEPAKEEPTHE